jgi:hypothetical protein
MRTITLDLNLNAIPFTGKYEHRSFDSFKVKYTSGKRVYITIINNGMRLTNISKLMKFEDGKVLISFGKNQLNIGTYLESKGA